MVIFCIGVLLRITLFDLTESSFRPKGCLVRFLYLLWSLVELLLACRLLSGNVSSPLLSLTPILMSSTGSLPRHSARLTVSSHLHQFLDQCTYRSLEMFKRSYRGRISNIWNSLQSDLLATPRPSWSSCCNN